jgi:hypothetical protein
MNAAPDRRTVLGAVLAAGACLSPALWGGASALIADPVLEAHRAPPAGLRRIHGGLGPDERVRSL